MYDTEFLEESILFLQEIEDNEEKKVWCSQYSVYRKNDNDLWDLENSLYKLLHKLYEEELVPSNYVDIYETIKNQDLYLRKPAATEIMELSTQQIVACIAKQARNDYFDNGSFIFRYVAKGYTNRANSVNPIYEGTKDISDKIHRCEELYKSQGLKPTYKITPFVCPRILINFLKR